jgi:AraC-like DNA-binding protein
MPKNGLTAKRNATAMSSANRSKAAAPAAASKPQESDGDSSPKLRGLDSNPQGHSGPRFWQAFRDTVTHLHTVSLPDPSEEARFSLSARTYAMPNAILMRCQGTALIMTRGPAQIAQGADQLLIYLQTEGTVDKNFSGRRARLEAGDVAITDYAQPTHSVASDYENLMVVFARESAPAELLALEPHGLIFPRQRRGLSDRRRNAGVLCPGRHLTVSEAEAVTEGIVAMATAFARTKLANNESNHVRSRKKAALDYINTHFANAQLGPGEIANAANVSRASLYRLLTAEGGIRLVLLKRRLDEALRLMLTDNKDKHSLKEIAKRCGFGGTTQFSRAFRARFGARPTQYREFVRRQDLDWLETRLVVDGFNEDFFFWRQQEFK